ncbi:DivIVA domain-containing protein [Chryseolinea sp. T2]|uniref:DivIVA domain-containing protein n=1 Tax=Chryseolinea sp. T2 TaxID=3129255 RepID=UPI003077761C
MRITPLDIRQKTFEKNFRGYEKEEVNAFLLTLSQEWERIIDENKELRIKLEATEREVTKLREVEGTLYKTLKTAEDTGANVIEQARTAADLHLRESQIQAELISQEAKTRAKDTIEEAEMTAREILDEMEDRLKQMIDSYKSLEAARIDMLAHFKHLATEAIERVDRARALSKDFDPDKHLALARREAKRVFSASMHDQPTHIPEPVLKQREREVILEERNPAAEPQPKKVQKSFFDEIG